MSKSVGSSIPVHGRRAAGSGARRSIVASILVAATTLPAAALAQTPRIVRADVVALDQLLVYNRFGSFNPYGMMFALRRDVSKLASTESLPRRPDADWCGGLLGTEAGEGDLEAGRVRLRDCKRPRPLVLRVNAGDVLELRIENLLRPDQPGISGAFADAPARKGKGFCEETRSAVAEAPVRADLLSGFDTPLVPPFRPSQCRETPEGGEAGAEQKAEAAGPGADWPRTRGLSLVVPGLEPAPLEGETEVKGVCKGLAALAPGENATCRWKTDREGTHLFSSLAAPAGGEGDGGSLTHGLFGALIVEPKGSRYFRSQVTSAAFDRIWPKGEARPEQPHLRGDKVNFALAVPDNAAPGDGFECRDGAAATVPILEMTRPCANLGPSTFEIVHGDLNALVVPPAGGDDPMPGAEQPESAHRQWRERHEARAPFREFTVIFHDELKTYYADAFKQLAKFGQLSGIRDGFAINYGASGVGSAVLANRLGIGPAADCPECLYEEFFLESWANGDPALLEAFPDDPSNVHHSYLNDKVVFRNFHAGKETHVFHLHSHQWFAGNDAGRGAYLDSQTIGPQQGFTYRIYHGGLERFGATGPAASTPRGWWDSLGTGNRNRTPGDAIFHCHLYPHFAQGMWALWRVHDVLEDGSRVLPDGQFLPGLSVGPNRNKTSKRHGSVGPAGEWVPAAGGRARLGTPVPGVIPLPGLGLPPLPTYTPPAIAATIAPDVELKTEAMPGYPFYIAGRPGHRSPQPPLDMARAEVDASGGIEPRHIHALGGRRYFDGGLPRHLVTGGLALPSVLKDISPELRQKTIEKGGVLARMLARGDMTSEFEHIDIELLPQAGTVLERNAMKFHGHGSGVAVMAATSAVPLAGTTIEEPDKVFAPGQTPQEPKTAIDRQTGAYPVPRIPREPSAGETTLQTDGWFAVNGANGAPGAPFADPCGAPLLFGQTNGPKHRRFDAHLGEWRQDVESFRSMPDPLRAAHPLVPDPGLLGFRRFHVSAVELTLVVNRAGWHDPQARINVLSAEAHNFKTRIRSDAEPFYFRAFSGECLEVRHTNETPKDLALDDFQMKVPTDTIGQHIHLVKFDVTSSDGSGNGFNYEDGTFAPDEVLARICKADRAALTRRAGEAAGSFEPLATRSAEECGEEFKKKLRGLQRLEADNIKYFQTTVQRWFADPILSESGEPAARRGVGDRTMRTVFTHDHFGPSNIQQHGFYSALLIEPSGHAVCAMGEPRSSTGDGKTCVLGPAARAHPSLPILALDPPRNLVGARANVLDYKQDIHHDGASGDPLHLDAREYAIAIADFALLYDGKREPSARREETNGIDRLVAEARSPTRPDTDAEEGEIAPNRFLHDHGVALTRSSPPPGEKTELAKLEDRQAELRAAYGRPIAPPTRPEAISQKHHDPYLVNYRNEPVPLRIGQKKGSPRPPSFLSIPCREPGVMASLPSASERVDSIDAQRAGAAGDLADLFRSEVHGDPCTPILEGLSGDRIVVRLIQGAQEVQHNFMVEGRTVRRNVDQTFPTERPAGPEGVPTFSRAAACASTPAAKSGRPRDFPKWAVVGPDDSTWPADERLNWQRFSRLIAGCDNPMGHQSSQEIGISEHFEVGGMFSAFRAGQDARSKLAAANPAVRPPPDPSTRPALDYLYHFGSTDAAWNGAWGLVRSYDSQNAPDLSACLWRPEENFNRCVDGKGTGLISERLTPLRELRHALTGVMDTEDPSTRREREGRKAGPKTVEVRPVRPSRPGELLRCEQITGHPVLAHIVALRAGDLFDDAPGKAQGIAYKDRLFDPDGLLFVPVPVEPATAAAAIAKAKDTLAASQSKPWLDPLVVRIEAGDCLRLSVFNALPSTSRACPAGSNQGDRPGDAPMPKIVPLNVDCDARQFDSTKPVDAQGPRMTRPDIAPSTRVALSLPLSAPEGKPYGTLPVGVNDIEAIAPGQSRTTDYYAGFLWVDEEELASKASAALKLLGNAGSPQIEGVKEQRLLETLFNGVPFRQLKPVSVEGCETRLQVVLLGSYLCLADDQPPDGTQTFLSAQAKSLETRLKVRDAVQAELGQQFADARVAGQFINTTPYAFGALPIRPLGDIISHGAHGLLGTLVVEPRGSAPHKRVPGPLTESFQYATAWKVKPPCIAFGTRPDGSLADDCSQGGSIPGTPYREHVLLWQDGLNLRGRPARGDVPRGEGRPVPDCAVCDDSYDLGEKGVSYRSEPFFHRLARRNATGAQSPYFGLNHYPRTGDDMNAVVFPADFFAWKAATPLVEVSSGGEFALRIAHPFGRARQRAFVPLFAGYDDLFPGFGSGHSALIGPGKGLTAWAKAPETQGCYLWRDGPQPIFAGGAWGHLAVGSAPDATCRSPLAADEAGRPR